jgi:hypothetical protein
LRAAPLNLRALTDFFFGPALLLLGDGAAHAVLTLAKT